MFEIKINNGFVNFQNTSMFRNEFNKWILEYTLKKKKIEKGETDPNSDVLSGYI